MMQGKTIALILSAVAFSAAGQLFMKSGAQRMAGLGRLAFLLAAARDMHVLVGLVAWTASTLCWLYVLRVTPLSRAYGATSLTYVLVFLASAYVFGEQVRRLQGVGMVLIVIGLACLLSGTETLCSTCVASASERATRAERGVRGPRERACKGVWGTKSPGKN